MKLIKRKELVAQRKHILATRQCTCGHPHSVHREFTTWDPIKFLPKLTYNKCMLCKFKVARHEFEESLEVYVDTMRRIEALNAQ